MQPNPKQCRPNSQGKLCTGGGSMIRVSQAQCDAAGLKVRKLSELCRFPKHERAILEFVLRHSFDIGETRAWLPSLDIIGAGSFIEHRPDVSVAVKSLTAKRVLQENPTHWYGINVLFLGWKVKHRELSGLARQMLLAIEDRPDLDEALRRNFVEFGDDESPKPARDTGTIPVIRPGQPEPVQHVGPVTVSEASARPEPGTARRAGED